MKNAGSLFLILGIGSAVLYFLGYEFRILSWIDNWGEGIGWSIRGGLIVIGGILFFLGMQSDEGGSEAEDEPPAESATAPHVAPGPAPGTHTSGGSEFN